MLALGISATAEADVTASRCSATELTCERAPLVLTKADKAPYDFDWDTGWIPNGSPLQVHLVARLHSRTQVDMEGTLDTTWPDALTLSPKGTAAKGKLTIDQGLEVTAEARFQVTIAGKTYGWTGNIPYIPQVDLLAKNAVVFDPWAWKSKPASVTADTPLTKLAKYSFTDSFINIPGIDGGFELDASASYSAVYDTLRIGIDEGKNGPKDVVDNSPTTRLLISRAPSIDTSIFVHGELTRQMTMHFVPAFYFSLLNQNFTLPLANIPVALPAGAPQPWDFPTIDVHVPLPQIDARSTIDAGTIPVNVATGVDVDVFDLGEEALSVSATTPAPMGFVDTKLLTLDSKKGGPVHVVVTPDKEGPFDIPVFLASNDPVVPVLEVHVKGIAGGSISGGSVDQTAGCGCETVTEKSSSSVPLLSLFGTIALVALRRRKRG
ncbi:hypothetical protein BH09MYX1_BH09MYX1_26060 [soil metagenome]